MKRIAIIYYYITSMFTIFFLIVQYFIALSYCSFFEKSNNFNTVHSMIYLNYLNIQSDSTRKRAKNFRNRFPSPAGLFCRFSTRDDHFTTDPCTLARGWRFMTFRVYPYTSWVYWPIWSSRLNIIYRTTPHMLKSVEPFRLQIVVFKVVFRAPLRIK